MYNPYDHYFKEAKKKWYKARSAFKLEEIDSKFKIFTSDVRTVLDIWCSPWSWIQFSYKRLNELGIKDYKIVWFDIKDTNLDLDWVKCFNQDITDMCNVDRIISSLKIEKFDVIISDMAPNTIWLKDIDSIRSIWLLEKTLPLYERYLKSDWKFVIKIFMWPWFDEFLQSVKKIYGWKSIKAFKPQAVRKQSKETYIIKV